MHFINKKNLIADQAWLPAVYFKTSDIYMYTVDGMVRQVLYGIQHGVTGAIYSKWKDETGATSNIASWNKWDMALWEGCYRGNEGGGTMVIGVQKAGQIVREFIDSEMCFFLIKRYWHNYSPIVVSTLAEHMCWKGE